MPRSSVGLPIQYCKSVRYGKKGMRAHRGDSHELDGLGRLDEGHGHAGHLKENTGRGREGGERGEGAEEEEKRKRRHVRHPQIDEAICKLIWASRCD